MLPFVVEFKTGMAAYEQVVYAVKEAIIFGGAEAGGSIPVRTGAEPEAS